MNRLLAILAAPLALLLTASIASAIDPIVELKESPNNTAFKDAGRDTPLVLNSAKQATKYFSDESIAALKKNVNFDEQYVLVFAWRGSGGDRLSFAVAESFPEQISFSLRPGRTRDLRSHTHVYVLRKNVRWSASKAGF